MMLDLGRLHLLRELHHRGTIAAVAAALSYSPSTVSRQLGELQREAGVVLFERSGRRLRLTGAAYALVQHAEILLAQMERAESEMVAATGQVAGIVRVSAFQTAMINIVSPALTRLSERHPALRVEVEWAEPERALEALVARETDLALCDEYDLGDVRGPADRGTSKTAEPGKRTAGAKGGAGAVARAAGSVQARPRARGLWFQELHDERVRLVLPAGHPLAGRPAVAVADLAGESWAAGHHGTGHERMVTMVCGLLGGCSPDIRHRSTDLLILLSLVAAGQAVTLLPDLAGAGRDPRVAIRDIAGASIRRRILTVAREDSLGWTSLTAVRDALHEIHEAGEHALRVGLAEARPAAAVDGGEDSVPQRDPGLQRGLDRLLALGPHRVAVSAEVGEHLHGHRGVLLPVHLDMPLEVVHEGAEVALSLVDLHDTVEHVGDQVLPAERERGRLAVHGSALDESPGGRHEVGRGGGRVDFLQRGEHWPSRTEERDQILDRGDVGTRLRHSLEVQLEMADESAAVLVALFDEDDVVDKATAGRRAARHPGNLDACQTALQGLQQ
jgi:DNA-binding transcriptional LysR family regulator